MPMSPYVRNRLIAAAAVLACVVGAFLIPPGERFKAVETDRPWAKDFRANLFKTSALDEQSIAQLSKSLCTGIQSEIKGGVSLQEGMAQIDGAMKQIGAHIGAVPAYINRGFITYYFAPGNTADPLPILHARAMSAFTGQGIGPGSNWLNPRWYGQNRGKSVESQVPRMVRIEGDFITAKFDTPFPVLEDFSKSGILAQPPRHVLGAAEYADLRFVKSERRDVFTYTYAIDMRRWYQALLESDQYYNVVFTVSARRNANGALDDLQTAVACQFPAKGVLYTAHGTPPGKPDAAIMPPVTIPSCPAYLEWFRCQHDKTRPECAKVPDAAPACPAQDPNFTKDDYKLLK